MIRIRNNVDCCGCKACGDICPKQAISFKTDIEGFWYPQINESKCINCGLCEKACPVINIAQLKKNDFDKPAHTIAAVNKNMRVRWDSTSGGAYTALAEGMLEQGGYISGAVYNNDFSVSSIVTNNPDDLPRLRSSKYLQSNPADLYKNIKQLLQNGEKVLACGTPCQMAALRSFLRKDYENLIIVDIICRGVNSPKVYRAYLDSLEKKYNSKVVYVKAKNKELGWRNLTRKVTFENGQSYYGVFMDDDFRRGYHTNVYCRPSCYNCLFKGFPRMADITIADYWGIEKVDKNLDMNIGTSMMLLNSKRTLKSLPKAVARRLFHLVKDAWCVIKHPVASFNTFLINHRKNTFLNKGKITVLPNVSLDIHPNAKITINKDIILGRSEIKNFWYPTCLKMEAGTELVVNDGPLTRYGNHPYLLRSGACIEIVNNGKLTIGQGACNVHLTIICAKEITIGNGVRIGRNVSIRDYNGVHVIINDHYTNYAPVHIGDHCWLCTGCTIMPGVTIGEGSVVAANATVTKNVPPHSLVAGSPAKVIKENIEWY